MKSTSRSASKYNWSGEKRNKNKSFVLENGSLGRIPTAGQAIKSHNNRYIKLTAID
jgi:hypothetical protein